MSITDFIHHNPSVILAIGERRPEAPDDYPLRRLTLSLQQRGMGRSLEFENSACDGDSLRAPEVVDIAQLPELATQHRKHIDGLIACLQGRLDRDYPNLPGEQTESDAATILREPYIGTPAGTAVVRRQTNMATLYFVLTDVHATPDGKLTLQQPTLPGASGPPLRLRASGWTAKSVAAGAAKAFASGMVGAIGGAIMGALLDQIFPPGVPSYFDEVYAEISRIVKRELDQQTIREINGALNTLAERLSTEYRPARQRLDISNADNRAHLFDLLQKYDTAFLSGPGGMLGTLQDKNYQVIGFGVFLLGASLQLSLFQEMANVASQRDDQGRWYPPLETSYGRPMVGTVAQTAKRYADFADRVWPEVLAARISTIDIVRYEANKRVIPGTGDVYFERWAKIVDGTSGYEGYHRQVDQDDKHGNNPKMDALRGELASYKTRIQTEFTAQFSDPKAIAASWRQLIETPMRVS